MFHNEINQPANGLAWIEISLIRTSSRGRKVFSFTGSFSSSSRVSSPSIILLQRMSVSYNSLPSTIITELNTKTIISLIFEMIKSSVGECYF